MITHNPQINWLVRSPTNNLNNQGPPFFMAQLVMFFLVVLDVLNCASLQLDVDDHSVSLASPKEIGEAGVEPTSLAFFSGGDVFFCDCWLLLLK